jgi:predicted transcriptional regulator
VIHVVQIPDLPSSFDLVRSSVDIRLQQLVTAGLHVSANFCTRCGRVRLRYQPAPSRNARPVHVHDRCSVIKFNSDFMSLNKPEYISDF